MRAGQPKPDYPVIEAQRVLTLTIEAYWDAIFTTDLGFEPTILQYDPWRVSEGIRVTLRTDTNWESFMPDVRSGEYEIWAHHKQPFLRQNPLKKPFGQEKANLNMVVRVKVFVINEKINHLEILEFDCVPD